MTYVANHGEFEEILFNTRRGVFRPGGHGGGIFDGNIAGLSGLGATCADVAADNAKTFCDANKGSLSVLGFSNIDQCVSEMTKSGMDNCGTSAPTTTASSSGSYPWGVYSDATAALQKSTNVSLKQFGYCPISTDGKLGPATCGARLALKSDIPGMTNPSTCQKFTAPRRAPCTSSSAPSAPTTLTADQQAALMSQYSGGSNWTKYLLFAGGAALVLGAAYYLDKKRKR